jgi:hypothetical protein
MLVLAIQQVCDTWFNGTIFANTRAYLEVWEGLESTRYVDRFLRFFAELLSCPFCLAHHVMFILVAVCWLPTFLTSCASWGSVPMIPVYGLAALRLSLVLSEKISDN